MSQSIPKTRTDYRSTDWGKKLIQYMSDLRDEYAIVAKSIGTAVASSPFTSIELSRRIGERDVERIAGVLDGLEQCIWENRNMLAGEIGTYVDAEAEMIADDDLYEIVARGVLYAAESKSNSDSDKTGGLQGGGVIAQWMSWMFLDE